jgi:hypothetical protein
MYPTIAAKDYVDLWQKIAGDVRVNEASPGIGVSSILLN